MRKAIGFCVMFFIKNNAGNKIILFLALALYAIAICAQSVSQEETITLQNEEFHWRNQQDTEERERHLAEPDINAQPEQEAASDQAEAKSAQLTDLPKDEAPCYPIKQFIFEIPIALPPSVLSTVGTSKPDDTFYFLTEKLEFARGRCLGIKGIGFLVDQLLLALVQRGYTTTRIGIVRNQDLTTGILKFSLLPGLVGKLRIQGEGPKKIKYAFPIQSGDLLNIRKLEQGLEQVERMTSVSITMQLEPGSEPGESDIVFTIKQGKPWRLVFSLDDSGSSTTGKLQSSIQLGWDNPLGINDTLTLALSHDLDMRWAQHGSRSMSCYYSIPVGNWTISTSATYSQSYYPYMTTSLIPKYFSTDRTQFDGKVSYMFWRNQVQKNSVEFRINRYISATSIGTQRWGGNPFLKNMPTQARNMTFAEISYLHRRHFGPARLDLTASYRWGVPWFGADWESRYAPSSQHYNLQIVDANLTLPFVMNKKIIYYVGTLRGQVTRTQQDSSNVFAVGSRWTVRGFDDQSSLSAYQGFYWRNDIQVPITNTQQSIYYGFDIGKVFGRPLSQSETIMGFTLGLRGALLKGLSYDVFFAAPVYRPNIMSSSLTAGFSLRQYF